MATTHFAVFEFRDGARAGFVSSTARSEPIRTDCTIGYMGHATMADALACLRRWTAERCDGHCAPYLAKQRRKAAQYERDDACAADAILSAHGPTGKGDAMSLPGKDGPKVRVGHERNDLLHLLDQVLFGDLVLLETFTKGETFLQICRARESICNAMHALRERPRDIELAEIAHANDDDAPSRLTLTERADLRDLWLVPHPTEAQRERIAELEARMEGARWHSLPVTASQPTTALATS